nr:MAG TPA: hypothetical protein [Caudoviricetes sp.]
MNVGVCPVSAQNCTYRHRVNYNLYNNIEERIKW